MKKPDKKETINLFFSAFLIIAFIVCAHFFSQFTKTIAGVGGQLISVLVYVVFGLLVFYATRVSDGKAVKRFSPLTLIILVLPSLYIIIASLAQFLPLNNVFAADPATGSVSTIVALASVALGYGIPYTFVSGFEVQSDKDEAIKSTVVEGGVEADILDSKDLEDAAVESTVETEKAAENVADDEDVAPEDEADETESGEESAE